MHDPMPYSNEDDRSGLSNTIFSFANTYDGEALRTAARIRHLDNLRPQTGESSLLSLLECTYGFVQL